MRKTKKAVCKAVEARKKAEAAKVARKARQSGIVIHSPEQVREFASVAPDFCQKGAVAEEFLHKLAQHTFFSLWSHLRPQRPDGRELCDLLVIYDQSALIWQVKNLKVDASDGLARERETKVNLRQLTGAKKALLELAHSGKPLQIAESKSQKYEIPLGGIEEIFLISALLGDEQACLSGMEEDKRGDLLHVLDRKDTEILMNELDTASDFIEYFRKKEEWLRERMDKGNVRMAIPGEEDMLACYLLSGRQFPSGNPDWLLVDKHWEDFTQSEKYRRLKEESKESRRWDSLIEYAQNTTLVARSKGNRVKEHEAIVRELARPNRRQRTALSQNIVSALDEIRAQGWKCAMCLLNKLSDLPVSYYFLFMDAKSPEEREYRKECLYNGTIHAWGESRENPRAIGIAVDIHDSSDSVFAYTLLDEANLTPEDINRAREFGVKWTSGGIRKKEVEDY